MVTLDQSVMILIGLLGKQFRTERGVSFVLFTFAVKSKRSLSGATKDPL